MEIRGRKIKSFENPDGSILVKVYQRNGDCRRIKDLDYECQDNCERAGISGYEGNGLFLSMEYSKSEEDSTLQPVSYLVPPFKYVQKEMEMFNARTPEEINGFYEKFEDLKSDLEEIKEDGKITCRSKKENEILYMFCECGMLSPEEFEECKGSLPKELLNEIEETRNYIELNIESLVKHAHKAD
ncbi:MAG: hypothetical protein JSV39_00820 [Candidatus Aenigmatarchaeota archaeon]|nr:MAG: hypothetical protein JSV39_00820 [Candidatus Aenigmarchaeota archaeon]